MNTYAKDGVDTKTGDKFSAIAGKVCRGTFNNSPFVQVLDLSPGHFRGPRAFKFTNLPEDCMFDLAPDGIGTKVVVIDAAADHYSACKDVLAMTMSDVTRWGGKSLVFVNVLDVATLGKPGDSTNMAYCQMMKGLAETAHGMQLVCFRGETAELGLCVGSENPDATAKWNWAGVILGAYLPDRMITGETLAPGQAIVSLREWGFRSNGLSTVRAAFGMKFGTEWWNNPEARPFIKQAATPSQLFDPFLTSMNGWTHPITKPRFKFHLITHVTGGGVVDKLGKDILFPRGLSAELDNPFEPSDIMKHVVEWRGMPEKEAYNVLNCDNGMLAVIDEKDVGAFVWEAKNYGHQAQRCGTIVESGSSKPSLTIKSG